MTTSSGQNDALSFGLGQPVGDNLTGIFMDTHAGSFPHSIPPEDPFETQLITGVPLAVNP